ncbi:major tail protein [Aureibacillus halotolerans]|uniref:Phi13 family phage major tail protein n=1 Tax=Aureibacillus halotolerans TaxID=1508390 RepID=A0A4V3D596_9BACI|nr:major tail protein [Aureibacillus halotolerans]TDQ39237.1 phi13 family phage major tail protein [Aureibacillus halotolerans]
MAARIGLKDFHTALVTSDDATGTVYETPEFLSKAISATITPTTNTATLYAEDSAAETATSLGPVNVVVNVRDLTTAQQARLLGHRITSDGVLASNKGDLAPELALGFRAEKSDGSYRYVWLLKGRFALSEDSYQTKEETPTFQTATINATFLPRESDGEWRFLADDNDEGFAGGAAWFESVYEETAPNP